MQYNAFETKMNFVNRLMTFYYYLDLGNPTKGSILKSIWDLDQQIQDWCCEALVDISCKNQPALLASINDIDRLRVFEKAVAMSASFIYITMLTKNPRLFILLDQLKEKDPNKYLLIINGINNDRSISDESKIGVLHDFIYVPLEQLYVIDREAFNKKVNDVMTNPSTAEDIRDLYNHFVNKLNNQYSPSFNASFARLFSPSTVGVQTASQPAITAPALRPSGSSKE